MKTSLNTKLTVIKRKASSPITIIVGLIVLVGLVWGGVTLFSALTKSTANYAEEVAKPLEAALVKAGGVKVCTQGDAGRSADNLHPGYNVVFETDLTKDEAVKQAISLAKDNGYDLAYNRSPNQYLDKYIDNTSKDSPYPDLLDGKIQLFVDFYSGGSNLGCSEKTVRYDANHAAIGLTVSLPEFRR